MIYSNKSQLEASALSGIVYNIVLWRVVLTRKSLATSTIVSKNLPYCKFSPFFTLPSLADWHRLGGAFIVDILKNGA